MKATKCLILNSDIQGSFKKFLLLLGQAEMVFVVVWFLDHFTLKPVPSVNGVWVIAFVSSHHHAWVTKSKPLSVLTSNNVVWMPFFTVLFDEAQHHNTLKTKPFRPDAGINKEEEDIFIIISGPGKVILDR